VERSLAWLRYDRWRSKDYEYPLEHIPGALADWFSSAAGEYCPLTMFLCAKHGFGAVGIRYDDRCQFRSGDRMKNCMLVGATGSDDAAGNLAVIV